MATRTTGYECDFVGNPLRARQFLCSICLLVLREPYQAICCGVNFCKECIHRVKAANEACPTCREKDFPLFHNKGLQQELYDFTVYCTHKSRGCEWIGELRELDNHLNSDPPADKALQGCPYTLIKCALGCAECKTRVYRKDVKVHAGGMPRCKVKAHASDKVKFTTKHVDMIQSVQTEAAGIKHKKRMTELESQFDRMTASKPQPLEQPQQPDRHVTGTYKPWPVGACFTMTDFDEYRRDDDTWYSPHFYTHPNGYKMCLHVDANGSASGQGTHLSVFVCLMQGEFDDQLKWPFRGNITIKLVNQEKDRDHVIKTFYSKTAGERCERVMTKERINNGWGIGQFLSYAELQPKYLKNDCIKFYIKKTDLY